MAKKVSDAMSEYTVTVSPDQTLTEAAEMMKASDVGSLPVVQDGRLVGIVTDRDIVVRAVAERVDPQGVRVGEVASRELVTITPDADLDEALRLMARHQIRRLPVVEQERLVGILAQADAALEAKEKQAGEMLQEISQPSGPSS